MRHQQPEGVDVRGYEIALGWLVHEDQMSNAEVEAAFAQSRQMAEARHYVAQKQRERARDAAALVACGCAVMLVAFAFALSAAFGIG